MNMKNAFTLAEVLITLGIIGIIAAMTLPALVNKYQAKVLRTRFLQANTIIHDGMQHAYLDGANMTEIMDNRDSNQLFKYFKSGKCKLPKDEKEAGYMDFSLRYKAAGASASDLVYPMCLSNGMVLWLGRLNNIASTYDHWVDSGFSILAIDINGWGKKPDAYGKDVFFWFYDNSTGKLIPSGIRISNLSNSPQFYLRCPVSLKKNLEESEAGIGCTAEALADKDYFNKLNLSH